jgi:L-threonylcarbamoyladenylate synthase
MDQKPLNNVLAAAAALARGDLVGLPTETVYGLGADATNAEAVAKIFAAKGRPHFNPLISHIASLEAAEALGLFSPLARKLAEAFWPGPLSLVVPRQPGCAVCDLACAGLDTIALRVPSHPLMQQVLRAFDKPIAAPSANVSGRPSPTTAAHVLEEFGDRIALVLDGGPSAIGLESAVVAVTGDQATLLRLGGLSREALEAVAGPLLTPDASAKAAPASPGMVLRHYAPRAPVRLDGSTADAGEVMIGFGPGFDGADFNLSPSGDLVEAAANLFALLRAADALNPAAIVIATIPETGLGEAIADRLARAAEP